MKEIKNRFMKSLQNQMKKSKKSSKCRSIPVVIVWDGEAIIKFSIKELAEYLLTVHGMPNVRNWFKQRGLPQKYKERVSFYGTAEEYYRLQKYWDLRLSEAKELLQQERYIEEK